MRRPFSAQLGVALGGAMPWVDVRESKTLGAVCFIILQGRRAFVRAMGQPRVEGGQGSRRLSGGWRSSAWNQTKEEKRADG